MQSWGKSHEIVIVGHLELAFGNRYKDPQLWKVSTNPDCWLTGYGRPPAKGGMGMAGLGGPWGFVLFFPFPASSGYASTGWLETGRTSFVSLLPTFYGDVTTNNKKSSLLGF